MTIYSLISSSTLSSSPQTVVFALVMVSSSPDTEVFALVMAVDQLLTWLTAGKDI